MLISPIQRLPNWLIGCIARRCSCKTSTPNLHKVSRSSNCECNFPQEIESDKVKNPPKCLDLNKSQQLHSRIFGHQEPPHKDQDQLCLNLINNLAILSHLWEFLRTSPQWLKCNPKAKLLRVQGLLMFWMIACTLTSATMLPLKGREKD